MSHLRRIRQAVDKAVSTGAAAAAAVERHGNGSIDIVAATAAAVAFTAEVLKLAALLEHSKPEDVVSASPHIMSPIMDGFGLVCLYSRTVNTWLRGPGSDAVSAVSALTELPPGWANLGAGNN
jgi:hypothetical protein